MRKTKKAGFEPVTLQLIGHLPLSYNLCPELIIAFCLLRKVNETNQTTSASFSDAAGKRPAWLPLLPLVACRPLNPACNNLAVVRRNITT